MTCLEHLPGIRSEMVTTVRIRSHVLTSGSDAGEPLLFLHGNLAAATYFEELMLSLPPGYRCIAPDLRGYGQTEDLPIDATRGARDTADDLEALCTALGIDTAHLVGWSAGAGVAMQFTISYPERVASLTLIAPVSPYGFGGTCDNKGTPSTVDFSGCGAGTVDAAVVEQLKMGGTDPDSPVSLLRLLREVFVEPPACIAREDMLVRATLQQKLGDRRYPGDFVSSPNWPYVAPGVWGPVNALSPKYYDTSGIVDLVDKPPILWVRGESDKVINDCSLFDLATSIEQDSQCANPHQDAPAARPQPMVTQMRDVLKQYSLNGGQVEEVSMQDVGHSPFLERPAEFVDAFCDFLARRSSVKGVT